MFAFNTYIVKVASRCNINCTYCFIYNREDSSWRDRPRFLSQTTLEKLCGQIVAHCSTYDQKTVDFIFHGGEPLLLGAARLDQYAGYVRKTLGRAGLSVRLAIQTNGLLFSDSIGDVANRHNILIGVSIDGPPEVNDRYRLDLLGAGTSSRLEPKLRLLSSDAYRERFAGFLSVLNVDSDPVEVYEYLKSFQPGGIDFLLPYDNWERRPPGKEDDKSTVYADWLITLFDHWIKDPAPVPIRCFQAYIREMFGAASGVESVGLRPARLVVIETDGSIEAVDSLKATYDRATDLELTLDHDHLNDAAAHFSVRARQLGADSLCTTCQSCNLRDVCGGGYLPTRYSNANLFVNPSIYCSDYKKMLPYIHGHVRNQLAKAARKAAAPFVNET